MEAFKPASRSFTVVAGKPLRVPAVTLVPADAVLVLASDPAGAAVTVDGKWRGETPVELVVAPRRPLAVKRDEGRARGRDAHRRDRPGESAARSRLRLAPELGEVKVEARPPDAELLVDGESRGAANQTLSLIACPTRSRSGGRATCRTSRR